MKPSDVLYVQKSCKGMLLDLDNTLYDYEPCHIFALQKCHAFFNAHIRPIELEDFYNLYLQGREAVKMHNSGTSGSHSRHLYFQLMFEIAYGKTNIEASLQLGDLYWKSFIENMKLRPWALELVQGAKKRDVKIVVITNQEASLQYKKLLHLNIASYIDFIVTSEEAGAEKPDPRIFALALEKIGMKSSEVVMISDDPHADGVGAKAAGVPFFLCG